MEAKGILRKSASTHKYKTPVSYSTDRKYSNLHKFDQNNGNENEISKNNDNKKSNYASPKLHTTLNLEKKLASTKESNKNVDNKKIVKLEHLDNKKVSN